MLKYLISSGLYIFVKIHRIALQVYLINLLLGGGGKGMRVVEHAGEVEEKISSCKREAMSAFKDDKILMEKYVRDGRHVEVQVRIMFVLYICSHWGMDCIGISYFSLLQFVFFLHRTCSELNLKNVKECT
jgi:hypothetical protein